MSESKITIAALKTNNQLFRILNGMRYFGVGAKVTRNTYHFPNTYWIVTKVRLSKDQNHGTAFGRLVWRGVSKDKDRKICTPYKHEWRLLETPNYKAFKGTYDEVVKSMPPGHPKQNVIETPITKQTDDVEEVNNAKIY